MCVFKSSLSEEYAAHSLPPTSLGRRRWGCHFQFLSLPHNSSLQLGQFLPRLAFEKSSLAKNVVTFMSPFLLIDSFFYAIVYPNVCILYTPPSQGVCVGELHCKFQKSFYFKGF